jgi:hypothetical protein
MEVWRCPSSCSTLRLASSANLTLTLRCTVCGLPLVRGVDERTGPILTVVRGGKR